MDANRTNVAYSILWPFNEMPKCIGPGIVLHPTRIPVTICINKLSTSKAQRDKFDKDLIRIARTDLLNK